MEIPSAITDARSEAARLGAAASDYASAAYTIPDQLKKYVQEALDYNKDVIGMRSKALADYQASPAQANAKFGVQQFQQGPTAGQANPDYIFNPFERNSAIQTFITNQGIPFSFANTLLGMREGTIADTVDAGTRAFQAQAAATQAAAEAARQTYQDVLNEFVQKTTLEQEQQKIDNAAKEAGGGGFDPYAWLAMQQQGEEVDGEQFIEEQPDKNQNSVPAPSQSLNTYVPGLWDRFMGFLGATPKQGMDQPTPLAQNLSTANIRGLNLNNMGLPGLGK